MADQDKQAREKIEARNTLENFAFQVKNAVNDEEKVGKKISEEDKKKVNTAVSETLEWLEENGNEATKDQLDEKRKSLEKTVRQQRKSIEKTVKTTNKDVNKQIEARVNEVTKRANQVQADVTKVADEQGKKAQELVNKVTEQLQALV